MFFVYSKVLEFFFLALKGLINKKGLVAGFLIFLACFKALLNMFPSISAKKSFRLKSPLCPRSSAQGVQLEAARAVSLGVESSSGCFFSLMFFGCVKNTRSLRKLKAF